MLHQSLQSSQTLGQFFEQLYLCIAELIIYGYVLASE